jgi:hypothetical protein
MYHYLNPRIRILFGSKFCYHRKFGTVRYRYLFFSRAFGNKKWDKKRADDHIRTQSLRHFLNETPWWFIIFSYPVHYSVCVGGDGYGMRALPPLLLQQELRPLQHGALSHRHCLPRYQYFMPLAAESEWFSRDPPLTFYRDCLTRWIWLLVTMMVSFRPK